MYRNIIGVILVGLHISIITSGHVAKRRDTNNAKGELLNELECLLNQHREQSYVHAQMVNLDKLELMRDELRKLLILMEGIYDGVATCVEEGNPNQISTHTPTSTVYTPKAYANCHEALLAGEKDSAVYWIQSSGLNSNDSEFYAFCDMTTDGGGWTVIQRRINGAVDFNRTWQEYRWGFGSLDGEYWLGLEHIQQLTASEPTKEMELYIILNQFNGDSRFAKYSTFSVEGDQYRLETAGYKGTSGGDGLNYSNGRGFSTFDHDNDGRNGGVSCTTERLGAWWYKDCMMSNLNGKYRKSAESSEKYGFSWFNLKNTYSYFLKGSVMMIRPK